MWRRSHARIAQIALAAILAASSAGSTSAIAQASIVGQVRAAATHSPVAGAIVSLAGSSTFSYTDDVGRFSLAPVGDGIHSVLVRRLGYLPSTVEAIVVAGGSSVAVAVELVAAPPALDSVVVRSTLAARENSTAPPRAVLSHEDINSAPQVAADVFRALARVPGVASSDLSAGFRVRGAPNREVLLLFDGVELYEPFHLKDFDGALSIIDPAILGSATLSTGGFGARYGDHLAGVLELYSQSEPAERGSTSLGASVAGFSAMHQMPLAGGRGDWLVSARRGMLGTALALAGGSRGLSPRYYDAYSRLRFRPTEHDEISLSFLRASDELRFDAEDMATLQSHHGSSYAWLNWRSSPSPRLTARSVLSYAQLDQRRDGWNDGGDLPELDVSDRRSFAALAIAQDWSFSASDWLEIDAGAKLQRLDATFDYTRLQVRSRVLAQRWVREANDAAATGSPASSAAGVYISQRLRPIRALTVETGARYDRRSETGAATVDPRASLALALGRGTTVHASWGRYSQPQELYELQLQDGVDELAPPERAEQRALGIEHHAGGLAISVDAYERRMLRVNPRYINLGSSMDVFPEAALDRVRIAPATGHARGLELAAAGEHEALEWSASYALAFNDYLVYGARVPDAFDQRHSLNLELAVHASESWRISAAWQLHSGWPVTPITFDVDTLSDGTHHVREHYGAINSARLALYHRLDLRVSNDRALGSGRLSIYLDVFNAYDRDNPRGLGYTVADWNAARAEVRKNPISQLPLLPTLGARWTF